MKTLHEIFQLPDAGATHLIVESPPLRFPLIIILTC